ncbi:MAG TPA: hypothetical protein VK833_03320 [Gillisia sp.]|nr:hypothetical protein [Gillisia sp.]
MSGKFIYKLSLYFFICGIYSTYFAQEIKVGLVELSKGADMIVTGKVIRQVSSWNEDNSRIYSLATVQVADYIKGFSAEETVTIKYLGGEVGEVGEMYSHMPRFEDNEEVLVFLEKDDKGSDYKVFNGDNGKINLVNDSQTGELVTSSNVQVSSLKAQIKSYIND